MFEHIAPAGRQALRIVLIEPDQDVRLGLRDALVQTGFRNLRDYPDLKRLPDELKNLETDLIVADANAPEGDTCQLIRDLRYGRHGGNPFISVILTVWRHQAGNVERLINSGADHIVVKPVAPKAVFDRMSALIERRPPFVATSTYVGPDRSSVQKTMAEVPLFHAPNTLKIKSIKHKIEINALQTAIDSTLTSMNTEMLDSLAFQVVFQARRFIPLATQTSASAPEALRDLKMAINEFRRRLDGSKHAAVAEMADRLRAQVAAMEETLATPLQRDLDLADRLAVALYVSFKSDGNVQALAEKINKALASFEKRTSAGGKK